MDKPRVLLSMPTRHHVEIAYDEMHGLREIGYCCEQFHYAAKEGYTSKPGRIYIILKNAFNLIKIAYRFKPTIVYFNSRVEVLAGVRDFITILLFKTFYYRKVYFVLKSHGSDLGALSHNNFFVSKILMPYLKKNISGWLFLSHEEKKEILKGNYLSANKVFITKNIIRVEQFKINHNFRANLNISPEYKILLFVGRIIKEKGVFDVVEAFAKIKDKHKTTLVIVGDGVDLENLKQFSETLGLSESILFTGFIPEPAVVDYYANCDILVFPTYFPEGFPMALFNSVAAGIGIVTTPTRAAFDYLYEPENCLWVQPQNSASIINAIDKLMKSVSLLPTMRINNLKKARRFSKHQVANELAEILNHIVYT